jgi:Tannase and feruloyl esterase
MRLLHRVPTTSAAVFLFALVVSLNVAGPFAQSPQSAARQADSTDAQRCAALAATDFGSLSGAPTRVTSARLLDVPPPDPKALPGTASAVLAASPIKHYCQVLGYVAPQNKFELRLPVPSQWNRKFHLTPCAGFCGYLNGNACNRSLARAYASATGNGGHDGGSDFDGVWAANSPHLQDFAWRHNHVITVAAKAITTKFYGQPIARSYMSGCSKGGHAVLMEAQRFPEDFDGMMPIASVYDLVGRVMAGAWWAAGTCRST